MKKFISLVLALVMALSLTTVAWGATLTAFPADDADGSADNVITLTDDVKLDAAATLSGVTVLIPADKTVVVDLNGKTLTTSGDVPVFEVKGNLTVKNGIITSTNTKAIFYGNNGSTANKGTSEAVLTLDGLTVTAASYIVNGNPVAPAWKSVTVTGGNYTTSGAGFIYDMAWDGVVTMTGVKATATGTKALVEVGGYGKSTATITDCTFTSAGTGVLGYAIGASYGAQVTINGGTYVGADIVAQAHETTYNGGPVPTVTINGGSFTGKLENNPAGVGEGEIVITGGTFTDDVSEYVADGLELNANGAVVPEGGAALTTLYDVEDTDTEALVEDVTVATYSAKKAKDLDKSGFIDDVDELGCVKHVVFSNMPGRFFVQVNSVNKADYTVYQAGTETLFGYFAEVNNPYYMGTGVAFYDFGDDCGQYDEEPEDGAKYYTFQGVLFVADKNAYDCLMVNNELTTVRALPDEFVDHSPVFTYDKDYKVVAVKCGECGTPAVIYANRASVPAADKKIGNLYPINGDEFYCWQEGPVADTDKDDKVESAETFDAGIAMYVGMSVMAAAGSAVVLKKKD